MEWFTESEKHLKLINSHKSFVDQIENLQQLLSESCLENSRLKLENLQLAQQLHQQGINHELELSNVTMKLKLMKEALAKKADIR